MDDLYGALIGNGPTPAEKQAVLANALRRQSQMAQMAQVSGDKVLAPMGQGMQKQADQYAEQLQGVNQSGIENQQRTRSQDQTQQYQEGQLAHMGASLAEQKRQADMEHAYRMKMAEAAQTKADKAGTGGGKIPRLRQGDIKELQDLSQAIGTVQSMEQFLAGGGKMGAKEIAGAPVPGSRALANTLASYGFGNQADKDTFLAKQNWDRLYTLAERNRLFGATLTPNEQKAWREANPSTNQTDKQIAEALPIMRKLFEHRMNSKVSGLSKEGYSPEAMADYADIPGINLPNQEPQGDPAQQMQPTGQRGRRVKVDLEGNIVGN